MGSARTVTMRTRVVTMRIEFLAIDVDGDGNTTGPDEGYFRVYQVRAASAYGLEYAMARTSAPPATAPTPGGVAGRDSILYSFNCGVATVVGGVTRVPTTFAAIPVAAIGTYRARMTAKQTAYDNANAKCFLGGDQRLNLERQLSGSHFRRRTRGN